jgi:hypothetical protein
VRLRIKGAPYVGSVKKKMRENKIKAFSRRSTPLRSMIDSRSGFAYTEHLFGDKPVEDEKPQFDIARKSNPVKRATM